MKTKQNKKQLVLEKSNLKRDVATSFVVCWLLCVGCCVVVVWWLCALCAWCCTLCIVCLRCVLLLTECVVCCVLCVENSHANAKKTQPCSEKQCGAPEKKFTLKNLKGLGDTHMQDTSVVNLENVRDS